MKRVLFLLLLQLPFFGINAQEQSMLIRKKSGELLSLAVDKVEEVRFVTTGNVQHNKWHFMLENPGIADYLRDFEYDPEDYSYHKIFEYRGDPYADQRQDWPYGVELSDTVIYNLIPNRQYDLLIKGSRHKFQTLGQLRMLKLQGLNNVRDLGGWRTEAGCLRYGCIIRGPELQTTLSDSDPQAAFHHATDEDLLTLKNEIGIRAELDLRSASEATGIHSALGEEIKYLNCRNCKPNTITGPDAAWVAPLQFILSCLNEQLPVYVHCRWGADRTGLLCMLIEGVLGVNESDLAKDFELTSFAGNTRYRTDPIFKESIAYIKSLPGNSLQEKFRYYWMASGAREEEISQLVSFMIE